MTGLERVEAVVRAVLYEGYMLYPYRPSSVKNRQRWTFGGIYPRACAAEDESLRSTMQTECLVEGGPEAVVEVRVRFLHLLNREVGRLDEPVADAAGRRRAADHDRGLARGRRDSASMPGRRRWSGRSRSRRRPSGG